jgi:fumarylacetoacetate (FAA) hydrolase
MKFVTFQGQNGEERLGLFINGGITDLQNSAANLGITLPSLMNRFLEGGPEYMSFAKETETAFINEQIKSSENTDEIKLLAPVPHPASCRDGYAFRQHVSTARRNRGLEMIPEFDQFPVFYFTNHNSIIGGGELVVEPDHLLNLDFELEIAAVIGKGGKNIRAGEADGYIAGFTIMNDFSARVLQMDEMKLNLGPAKGKDFATAIGPWLVTPDELEEYKISTPDGNKYDLKMKAFHNGKQVSDGNMKDMNWTFAQLIERVSYGVQIYPGDVIGSGTVGTGCYLELNGTRALEAKEKGVSFTPVWLHSGDLIELEVTGLGRLSHKIVNSGSGYSLKK